MRELRQRASVPSVPEHMPAFNAGCGLEINMNNLICISSQIHDSSFEKTVSTPVLLFDLRNSYFIFTHQFNKMFPPFLMWQVLWW